MQQKQTTKLRALLRSKTFLHMPSVYNALGGRLVESLGFEAAYIGGYVTGGSTAITEPLLTMNEQIRLAADVSREHQHSADGRRRRGLGRADPHHAHDARIHPRRRRRHPHRGRALSEARALSQVRRARRAGRGVRRKSRVLVQGARPQRSRFRDHRAHRHLPRAGPRRGEHAAQSRRRRRRRPGAAVSRARRRKPKMRRRMPAAARLRAKPRQPRRPSDLFAQGPAADGLRGLHRSAGRAVQRRFIFSRRR